MANFALYARLSPNWREWQHRPTCHENWPYQMLDFDQTPE